jgi:AcrR family transcriptional regulator
MSAVPANETSRRERKKDATRAAIQRAALSLTEKLGLEAVTVEAISEAADVAPRTFFNYFASKEEALAGEDSRMVAEFMAAIAARPPEESAPEAVHAALREFSIFQSSSDHRQLNRQRMRLAAHYPSLLARQMAAFRRFEQLLAEAIAARTHVDREKDPYPDLLAAVAITLVRLSFQRWARHGKNPARTFDELFQKIEKGL